MSRGHEQVVCDRRILKAFYTQYVAVLLIILVFSVGAFQRAPARQARVTASPSVSKHAPPVGTLEISQDFDRAGALVGEPLQLQAVTTVVKEHDLRALVTVPLSSTNDEDELVGVEVDLARVDALESYLLSQGLPEDAFQLFLGGADAREGKITIQFQDHHHDNLPF